MTKSFEKLRWHFFWIGMYTDLINFIHKHDSFQKLKNPVGKQRIRPVSHKPWDVVSTDVLHLPESANSFKYVSLQIKIIVDTFSRSIEALPLIAVNGQSVSDVLKAKSKF